MSSSYEVELYWSGPASDVIVTGSFDNWSKSIHLSKSGSGKFVTKVSVPYATKVDYKYIVDGQWLVNSDFPTTWDKQGNINNYIMTPPAPKPVEPEPAPIPEPAAVEPEPTPAPEPISTTTAAVEEAKKDAEPEPVTPVNPPIAAAAAVTPMAVPDSAVAPHPELAVDPAVSRTVITAISEIVAETPAPVVASPEPIVEAKVVIVEKPTVDVPAVEKEVVAAVTALQLNSPQEEKQAPLEAPPVAPARPTTPPPAPAAVPSTPPPVNGIKEKVVSPPATPASTKAAPTTPDRPTLGRGKGSSRSSRMFSFGHNRKASSDNTSEPSTPPSSMKRGDESTRKKKNSFVGKLQDVFHIKH